MSDQPSTAMWCSRSSSTPPSASASQQACSILRLGQVERLGEQPVGEACCQSPRPRPAVPVRFQPRVVRLGHHLAKAVGGGGRSRSAAPGAAPPAAAGRAAAPARRRRRPAGRPARRCRPRDRGSCCCSSQSRCCSVVAGAELAHRCDHRRRVGRAGLAPAGRDRVGQLGRARPAAPAAGRQLAAPAPPDLEAQPQRLERVAAAGDPAVTRAQPAHAQHLAGHVQHLALPVGAPSRSRVRVGVGTPRRVLAAQQRVLVDLAVGVERQRLDQVDPVRAHVGRQARRQVPLEGLERQLLAQHQVGQQLVRPRARRPGGCRRRPGAPPDGPAAAAPAHPARSGSHAP